MKGLLDLTAFVIAFSHYYVVVCLPVKVSNLLGHHAPAWLQHKVEHIEIQESEGES